MGYPFYNFHAIKAAYIHASDVCNFQCKTCKLPQTKKKSFVPLETLKNKIKKAADLGLNKFIFTGQEIIFHPNIDEIIRFSFENCRANYITFNTNGLAFANDLTWQKLKSVKEYLNKVYIAISVNFYDKRTFSDWSGHKESVFPKWVLGFKKAISSYLNISSVDVILKKDVDIIKIIDFLEKISNKKNDYPEGLRIIDLMPFGYTRGQLYKKLKYRLIETNKKISKIAKRYPRKIHFESFPICLFNQEDLKNKKYFIYNFHLSFEKGLLTQYDENIYETYYSGPTENWLINQKELFDAYNKMFCFVDECKNCYYRDKCYGIQREYLKIYPKKEVNKEIRLLKSVNWK
jgi:molybdenum cofactor biosynthesis enzyme MoaA